MDTTYQLEHSPGLWRHKQIPALLSPIVGNFGINYAEEEHSMHLFTCSKKYYDEVFTDWKGNYMQA